MRRVTIHNCDGFSIIEVLASLAIFGIMMTGFATLLVGSLRATGVAQRMTIAANVAQDKLEDVRNSGTTACTNSNVTQGELTYAVTCATANGPVSSTQAVTITAAWTDLSTHSITLQTLIIP
jgi:prepilin-type N-terminal cleavage/methylation domain-containing protein